MHPNLKKGLAKMSCLTQRQQEFWQQLAIRQQPHTLVITCVDSRLDPNFIFQANPGELLVCRNIAALVPKYERSHVDSTQAALEFAVTELKVQEVLILGHSDCGGMRAMQENLLPDSDYINDWLSQARHCCGHDLLTTTEQTLRDSVQNCLTYPWVKKLYDAGGLLVSAYYFDIATTKLRHVASSGT